MQGVSDRASVVPEVVPADKTLKTASKDRMPKVLTDLRGLVSPPVPVTEVGGLGSASVEPKALLRARCGTTSCQLPPSKESMYPIHAYKPMALAQFSIPSPVRTSGELSPDIITYVIAVQVSSI